MPSSGKPLQVLQNKPNFTGLKIVGILFAVGIGGGMLFAVRDWWVFTHMTAKDHLWEAKVALDTPADLDLSLRHLEAIPANASEATKAQVLEKEVRQQESNRKIAEYDKVIAKSNSLRARSEAISQLSADLKNLGYDLSVEANAESPNEIIITVSEFNETDHRVRFLAFIRGTNAPVGGICWNGFDRVRLRSSKIPLLGFNESYSLNCSR